MVGEIGQGGKVCKMEIINLYTLFHGCLFICLFIYRHRFVKMSGYWFIWQVHNERRHTNTQVLVFSLSLSVCLFLSLYIYVICLTSQEDKHKNNILWKPGHEKRHNHTNDSNILI